MSENAVELIVKVNEKVLPLNPFVQRIMRKAVLAMLSTLKGVEIQGDEALEIRVKRSV